MDAVIKRGLRDLLKLGGIALRHTIIDIVNYRRNLLLSSSRYLEFGSVGSKIEGMVVVGMVRLS